MKYNSFAERLNFALDKEGFPAKNRGRIQLLAEIAGITHRGASKWINGETCPTSKKYAALAKKLNVREEWLKLGQEPMLPKSDENLVIAQNRKDTIKIPVYTVDNFLFKKKKSAYAINYHQPIVGELFGIELQTEAMSPRFPEGSLIIFDDKKFPRDGDFVLVDFKNYPTPIFRQLFIIGTDFYLHAYNPKFERLVLNSQSKILGVLVQAILLFK